MVKKSKTHVPGRGQPPKGDRVKSGRLLMRVHPDLLPLIDVHARERAMTRSQFVEQMLVGFLRLDPRAPRITAFGQLEPLPEGTPAPVQTRPFAFPRPATPPNAHLFLRRWDDFRKASELVTGYVPPDTLIEDYVHTGPAEESENYGQAAMDRWARKPR
jgi:hypothetical protein